MAQDSLRRLSLIAAVVAFGVGCEVAAASSAWWAVLDFAVGCVAAVGGAELFGRSPRAWMLAVAFAVLWFCGTLSSELPLAYRGPLLQLLLAVGPRRRSVTALVVAGWVGGLLPYGVASPLTSTLAGVAALLLLASARAAAADARGAVFAAGAVTLMLAAVWSVAAAASWHGGLLLGLSDVAVLAALAVALGAAAGFFAREAERALVIELGPAGRHTHPVATRLGRALADPKLEIRYRVPEFGWVDEHGHDVESPPESGRLTRVASPGGGEVVLIHGEKTSADSRLARSAASAAALLLESARLDAEVRLRMRDVAASRRRLLGAADAERQALEQRLTESVLLRLRRVDRLLARRSLERERRELWVAVEELVALGRGLYPPSLERADLARALREIADGSGVAVTTEIVGDPNLLSEPQRAAVWFICSECLTNVVRHARAESAWIRLHASGERAELEVEDDGRGGAKPERGLRGLTDRVEALGGRLDLASPAGGPTLLRVVLPAP